MSAALQVADAVTPAALGAPVRTRAKNAYEVFADLEALNPLPVRLVADAAPARQVKAAPATAQVTLTPVAAGKPAPTPAYVGDCVDVPDDELERSYVQHHAVPTDVWPTKPAEAAQWFREALAEHGHWTMVREYHLRRRLKSTLPREACAGFCAQDAVEALSEPAIPAVLWFEALEALLFVGKRDGREACFVYNVDCAEGRLLDSGSPIVRLKPEHFPEHSSLLTRKTPSPRRGAREAKAEGGPSKRLGRTEGAVLRIFSERSPETVSDINEVVSSVCNDQGASTSNARRAVRNLVDKGELFRQGEKLSLRAFATPDPDSDSSKPDTVRSPALREALRVARECLRGGTGRMDADELADALVIRCSDHFNCEDEPAQRRQAEQWIAKLVATEHLQRQGDEITL